MKEREEQTTEAQMQDAQEREVIVASHAGFCFGVERAVEEVEHQIALDKRIVTYGEIIHNEEVVRSFAEQGVRVIESAEDLAAGSDATVIIRSHGISEAEQEALRKTGCEIVDATCPFVKRIHRIVREAGEQGQTVIVVGAPDHPEVRGIVGWAKGPIHVVETPEMAESLRLPQGAEVTVVAQTTCQYEKFQEAVEIFLQKGYNVHIMNTICSATEERQTEAREIAATVDAMIVIGGAHSSNTRKLYEICRQKCAHTYYIQTQGDLQRDGFVPVKRTGITAGASTPKNIIEEVQAYVRTGTVI